MALSLTFSSPKMPADVIRHRVDKEPGLSSRMTTSGHPIIWHRGNIVG